MSDNYLKECKQQMKQLHHTSMAKFWKQYIYRDTSVSDKTPYHGLLMNKMQCDILIYTDLFYRFKPDTIIEIGTARGGSSYFFKDTSNAKVITIDIHHCPNKKDGIIYIQGDATNQDIFDKVKKIARGNIWVVDDGSHMIKDITASFKLYNELIKPDGFYIVEDGMSGLLFKDHPNRQPCITIDYILNNFNYDLFTDYDKFVPSSLLRGVLRKNVGIK